MTIKEANNIIAEYMGYEFNKEVESWYYKGNGPPVELLFKESIDALIPVWQKLGNPLDIAISVFSEGRGLVYVGEGLENKAHRETVQEAACIATARAIKNKNNGN